MTMTHECEQLGLIAVPITSDVDVEILRTIRNACRYGFSHDTSEISPGAQHAWWVLMRSRLKAWLYWKIEGVVGYGLLRQTDDGKWWSSVAVLPECAGNGYGGAITADLIRRSDTVVWAEARLDRPVAMKLHRVADWEEYKRDETHAHYYTRDHVYDAILADWAERGVIVT